MKQGDSALTRRVAGVLVISLVLFSSLQAGAGEKGVLRFAMHGGPMGIDRKGTLNPLRTFQGLHLTLQHQIFETLLEIDFNRQDIAPALAIHWRRVDERTVEFHLRRGVRFHNGEPFNAAAVKFSLELMLDPRNKYAGRFLLDAIEKVEAIDNYTVRVTTRHRDALLLRKLAVVGLMFPPKYFKEVGPEYFTRYPMGTGPFRFFYREHMEDGSEEIHLVANEDYWLTMQPYLRELVFKFVPRAKQWGALKNDEVDLVIDLRIEREDERDKPASLEVVERRTLRNAVCLLNVDKDGPLADLRVRRALQHAINRGVIVEEALHGWGEPLSSVAPRGTLGHNEDLVAYPEDVGRSRELLREAGHDEGFSLKVMASEVAPTPQVVAVLKEQLGRIGVALEVNTYTRRELLEKVVYPKLMGVSKPSEFDMWVVAGWPSIFGAGAYFDFLFLHSRGMYNVGVYSGKESQVDKISRPICSRAVPCDPSLPERYCLRDAEGSEV
jgi:peptide/nickel transport system substrate-binding protein